MSYWNPTGESKPDHHELVLVSYINDMGKRQVAVGYWLDDRCDGEGWYEQQLNYGEYTAIWIHDGNVTHWQALPKMPD